MRRQLNYKWLLLLILYFLLLRSFIHFLHTVVFPKEFYRKIRPRADDIWKTVDMDAKEEDMKMRRLQLQDVCRKYGNPTVGNRVSKLKTYTLMLPKYNLSYCHMPKTSSTTMVTHMLEMSDIPEKKWRGKYYNGMRINKFNVLAEKHSYAALSETVSLSSINNVLIVRHPFVRLVSAFRMRQTNLSAVIRQIDPSVHDPVSFSSFVDFLTSNSDFRTSLPDIHIQKCWEICDVCSYRVDYLLKVETRDEDMIYLRNKLGLPMTSYDLTMKQQAGESSEMLAHAWFSHLSREQIQALHKVYKMDFDLFGYSVEEFL